MCNYKLTFKKTYSIIDSQITQSAFGGKVWAKKLFG